MKNLKVSKKLMTGFLIVVVLTVIVGGIGILGLNQMINANSDMYEKTVVPMPSLAKAKETLQATRVSVREMVIAVFYGEPENIERALSEIGAYVDEMAYELDTFGSQIYNDDIRTSFNAGRTAYERDLVPVVLTICGASQTGDMETIHEYLELCRIYADIVIDNFNTAMTLAVASAEEAQADAAALGNTQLIIIIVVIVVAAVAAMVLAFYISGLISKPLGFMSQALDMIGNKGDMNLPPDIAKSAGECMERKDEIGVCARAFGAVVGRLTVVGETLTKIAGGDLTSEISLLSDKDEMGKSLQQMMESLNEMFGNINSSTSQVSVGAKQVADGAQSLAQGSTEQASSIEELSASIGEIANKTKENAEMAERAATLAGSIMQNAEKGSHQMDEMMNAVNEINEASQAIGKVIKTIDDIAFQTNILALNAAVEAARAGQHGKGFAVVAEEVRNLAAKSADAAKETGDMIQNSMEKAQLGSRIAGETAESLTEIVSGITESGALIGDIARSSDEQSAGISQINTGIDQVAQVVQQNSATAQESAAASQEMSAQSTVLQDLVAQFKLKKNSIGGLPGITAQPPKQLDAPQESVYSPAVPDTDFGKY